MTNHKLSKNPANSNPRYCETNSNHRLQNPVTIYHQKPITSDNIFSHRKKDPTSLMLQNAIASLLSTTQMQSKKLNTRKSI